MQRTWGVLALVLVTVAAAAPALAEPGSEAAVDVAILDAKGAPVFCTRNLTAGRARPDSGGGYRLTGLAPGKWVVSLDLPYERVDILVTAAAGETVVVPPVIARGWCRSIAVNRRLDLRRLEAPPATWSVRYDRTYRSQRGKIATGSRFDVKTR
ncbi:MAG: hypothetical protein K8M05_30340 [Deltaproteobacteria bacterium]|nr:hypothetical protein [Kofleriaceae bacterium]